MRSILARIGVVAVAVAALTLAVRAADEKPEKIAFDKAPKAIQSAVNGRFPGAEVTSLTKEKEGDKIVFDVELTHKGRKYEMDILDNGTVIEVEKEVKLKDAPAALAKTVEAKYPNSKIKDIMEVNKVSGKTETPDHYEVTVETADKKTAEVLVSLDGKSVRSEAPAAPPSGPCGRRPGSRSNRSSNPPAPGRTASSASARPPARGGRRRDCRRSKCH
jgi:uncharacterized membrane protein YkoI